MIVFSNPNFEDLLGKSISKAETYCNGDMTSEGNMHWIWNSKLGFLEKPYNHITMTTNENNTIISITLYIPEIIDKTYFERICERYGNVNRILVIDKLISEEKSVFRNQRLEDGKYLLKDGSFDDKPFYLYWNKKDFQIRVCLDYNNGLTTILFREPTTEL